MSDRGVTTPITEEHVAALLAEVKSHKEALGQLTTENEALLRIDSVTSCQVRLIYSLFLFFW